MEENLEELIKTFTQGGTSEDRTVYIRITPKGKKVDFIVIEKTDFSTNIPQTEKQLITQLPLDCNHAIGRGIVFTGYCSLCGKEYCNLCSTQCRRCRRFIARCCSRYFKRYIFCKRCHKILWAKRLYYFFIKPFTDEQIKEIEDVVQETKPATPPTNTEQA